MGRARTLEVAAREGRRFDLGPAFLKSWWIAPVIYPFILSIPVEGQRKPSAGSPR